MYTLIFFKYLVRSNCIILFLKTHSNVCYVFYERKTQVYAKSTYDLRFYSNMFLIVFGTLILISFSIISILQLLPLFDIIQVSNLTLPADKV